jgi:cytochrome c oxidase subunit 2
MSFPFRLPRLPFWAGVFALMTSGSFAWAQQAAGVSNPYWAPENVTVGGELVDILLNTIFWLTTVVFILVTTVYIYFLVRYRRRAGVKAHYSHGNNALEVVWTAIPAAIFLGLALWGNHYWSILHSDPPEGALKVDIVSYQFGFDMRYAGRDGVLGSADDLSFTMENRFGQDADDPAGVDDFSALELVIPANRPVHFYLRSRDVIHSFYVPAFRLYQDMVPGRTVGWVWVEVKRPGEFELACSQLCGTGHFNMKARIRVLDPEAFDAWYAERAEAAAVAAGLPPAEEVPAPIAQAAP